MIQRIIVPLLKPGSLVIGRCECSSNLWSYLCDRYNASPSHTVQLVLVEPPRMAEVYVKGHGEHSRT